MASPLEEGGVQYFGKKYHNHDFVLYHSTTPQTPAHIGKIQEIKFSGSSHVLIKVLKVGRISALSHIVPDVSLDGLPVYDEVCEVLALSYQFTNILHFRDIYNSFQKTQRPIFPLLAFNTLAFGRTILRLRLSGV